MHEPGNDPLAIAANKPDIDELTREYNRSAFHLNDHVRQRKELAENTRYAQWDNQNDDGKKHDTEKRQAFPFEGASDTRIRLADQIINDQVDILCAGFTRAQPVADGIEAADAEQAGTVTKALEWARGGGLPGLDHEVELLAQYAGTFGYGIAHTIWERLVSKRMQEITLQQILELSQEIPDGGFENLPDLLRNPDMDDSSAEMLVEMYYTIARMSAPELADEEIIKVTRKDTKKWVKALREDAKIEIQVAYLSKNNPRIIALKPYEEVFFPPETTDIDRARVIFRVEWSTEMEMRSHIRSDGWDEDWAEAAIKTAGAESMPQLFNSSPTVSVNIWPSEFRTNLIETVWAYTRQVNDEGHECIYCTVFSPHVSKTNEAKDHYAKHGPLNYSHGEYPFKVYRRDRPERRIWSSRGVPELVFTWQDEIKSQRDSMIDRTSLSVMPPLRTDPRNRGKILRLAPGQTVFARKDETDWMQPPPGRPDEAVKVITDIVNNADQYFGRFSDGADPATMIIKRQKLVDTFLATWVDIFKQVLALMQQFFSDEDWMQITGSTMKNMRLEAIQRGYDWKMKFDVRELNTEFMIQKLETFVNFVVATDRSGVIDMAKLTKVIASWVDPTIARAVIAEEGGASRKMYEKVQNDMALMMLGNQVEMVENDPTSAMQLKFAEQIIGQNQKYQQAMQGGDDTFKELVEMWIKNRQQSVMQQENKNIGRTGVKAAPGGGQGGAPSY